MNPLSYRHAGEVAEWPNVTDSKSVVVETRPGVRIPPSPRFDAVKLYNCLKADQG